MRKKPTSTPTAPGSSVPSHPPRLFACYRQTAERLRCLQEHTPSAHRSYLLAGADRLEQQDWQLSYNLSRSPGTIAHHLGVWSSNFLHNHGGYGGDFPSCFKNLHQANQCDLIWSTVDTLGIPLSILKKLNWLRPPLVYTSIGLPERLEKMPDGKLKRWQRSALNSCQAMICYGWAEADYLREKLSIPIHFIPYGVDTETWKPMDHPKTVDVLALGIDTQRDFPQLKTFAIQHPEKSLRIITNEAHRKSLQDFPDNVQIDDPIPLADIPLAMASAKVIALPVKENTYSGATTTLLQAMAMGLPVVVSNVAAISGGYEFKQHNSCLPVSPGDAEAFSNALFDLLENPQSQAIMSQRARAHCESAFSWDQFVSRIDSVLRTHLT
ncbi:glycosyltransferase family 4 protein [Kiritimatiellota bacterium B12222]|nr:glycosyltransferase family 4 protein [Kiritimatiellota bacterium B12222]